MSGPFFDPETVVVARDAGAVARQRGGLQPIPSTNGSEPVAQASDNGESWTPLDLADPQYAIPPEPPVYLDLIYSAKRHVISGTPESAKTLVAYIICLTVIRAGSHVAVIDFEMGPTAARRLFTDLGATQDELGAVYYVTPDRPPPDELQAVICRRPGLVLIDAAAGAYDASGLDDNARKDAEKFARQWTRPVWDAGIATLTIDHVVKSVEGRGKFAIGSERKVGQADVHLGLEAVKSITRGSSGIVKVHVHKDRPGFLRRPHAALFDLTSDPATHAITWSVHEAQSIDEHTGTFRPTRLMENVSRYLESMTEAVSRTQVETTVKGKSAEWIRKALDVLVHEGFAQEEKGPRNARLVTSLKAYREASQPTPSDPVSPRPDGVNPPRPTPSPSTEGTGRGDSAQTSSPRPDDIDEQDEALIAYYATVEPGWSE